MVERVAVTHRRRRFESFLRSRGSNDGPMKRSWSNGTTAPRHGAEGSSALPGGLRNSGAYELVGATHGDRGPDGVDARSWPWRSAVRIRSVTRGTLVHRSRRGRRPRRSHKPSDPGSTPGAATMPVLLGWPSACLVIRSPRVRLSPPARRWCWRSLSGQMRRTRVLPARDGAVRPSDSAVRSGAHAHRVH